MTCPGCGTENQDTAEACASCGLALVLPVGTVLADRYLVEGLLGVGGLGRVYRAHDRMLEEDVAVKVLHTEAARSPEMSHRFRSEIKLARKVRHRNVCAIHEYGEHGGHRFVAMELVDGVDLHRVLHERGPLPPREAYELSIEVARGLAAIHAAGIIHRDLKTPNIMRDRQGGVRLLDFGIAKSMYHTGSLITAVQKVVGTPEYMSPEQIRGDDLDERSDIYGLGVVIYELFTGQVPFQGKTPMDTLVKQMNTPPPLYGEAAARLPESLLPVLRRCLAKRRDERFRSARDVLDALRAAQRSAFPATVTPLDLPAEKGPTAPLLTPATLTPPPATPPPVTPTPVTPTPVVEPPPERPVPAGVGPATPRPDALSPIGPPRNPLPGAPPLPQERQAKDPPRGSNIGGLGIALALFGLLAVVGARAWKSLPLANPRRPAPALATLPPGASPSGPAPVSPSPSAASELPSSSPVAESAGADAAHAVPSAESRTQGRRGTAPSQAPLPLPSPLPTPATTGRLEIVVTPEAALAVDGRAMGTAARHSIELGPGSHSLELTHPDYWPLLRRVQIAAGGDHHLGIDVAGEAVARARTREAPFTTPLEGSPSDPYFDRGLRQMAAGDFQEAVLTLEPVALRLQRAGKEKEQARAELYLGVAFVELGRIDRARDRFERALDLDGSLKLPAGGFSARVAGLFGDARAAARARP